MTMSEDEGEDLSLSPVQKQAVLQLIVDFQTFSGWTTARIAKDTGEVPAALYDMLRKEPKKQPSKRLGLAMIAVAKHWGMSFSEPLRRNLGPLWHTPPAGSLTFVSALSIDQTVAQQSMQCFNGDYLHFVVSAEREILTTKFHLLNRTGHDLAPVLSAERMQEKKERQFSGTYFCSISTISNLYLIASPEGIVNLRLSVFNVEPTRPERQSIIRGMSLGVGRTNTILASRCVLVPMNFTPHVDELYKQPMARPDFELLGDEFLEIARFLYLEEQVPYIKVAVQD